VQPCSYLCMGGCSSDAKFCVRTGLFVFQNCLNSTHVVARKLAIVWRTSVSLRVVSSNPGVSIKTTRRPSRSKDPAICTALVQDRNPLPTTRSDPLMRLMNCGSRPGQGGIHNELAWQYTTAGETAYRGLSASRRTHNAIGPSRLMDRPRPMRSGGFVWGRGT